MRRTLSSPSYAGRRTRAFTLVEILVSMSVLILLGVIVAQILNTTVSTTTGTEKQIESNAEARLIFDRLGRDLSGMARHASINSLFRSRPGNDDFYFFSETTGYFAGDAATASVTANSYSLIGYRISDQISSESRFELERMGRGLQWDDSSAVSSPNGPGVSLVYLPITIETEFNKALEEPYNNSSNLRPSSAAGDNVPQWDVIGGQVFRMEFCFLLKNGELSDLPVLFPASLTHKMNATAAPTGNDDSGKGYAPGSRWYDQSHQIVYICSDALAGDAIWRPLGWEDVQSVVVALALLDSRSRLIGSAATLKKLAAVLSDFDPDKIDPSTGQPYLMDAVWSKTINRPDFAQLAGVVANTAVVRIYQQHFDIN